MKWISNNVKWLMVISGALTCTMVYAAINPQGALKSNFGDTIEGGAIGEIVVRNWGILIALMGAMLIAGAFNPPARALILTIAGASKIAFIALVLTFGSTLLAYQVGTAVVLDSIMVLLYALSLIAMKLQPKTA